MSRTEDVGALALAFVPGATGVGSLPRAHRDFRFGGDVDVPLVPLLLLLALSVLPPPPHLLFLFLAVPVPVPVPVAAVDLILSFPPFTSIDFKYSFRAAFQPSQVTTSRQNDG